MWKLCTGNKKKWVMKHDTIMQFNIPTVDKLPREWYDPEEDAEWEAYLEPENLPEHPDENKT